MTQRLEAKCLELCFNRFDLVNISEEKPNDIFYVSRRKPVSLSLSCRHYWDIAMISPFCFPIPRCILRDVFRQLINHHKQQNRFFNERIHKFSSFSFALRSEDILTCREIEIIKNTWELFQSKRGLQERHTREFLYFRLLSPFEDIVEDYCLCFWSGAIR